MNLRSRFKLERKYVPLSLTTLNQSWVDVDWGINQFPDGQIQFKLLDTKDRSGSYRLTCSIINSVDLDLFMQMASTLHFEEVIIKYMYGARSDKNVAGDHAVCNVATMMSCMFVRELHDSKITVWNPHCNISSLIRQYIPVPQELYELAFSGVVYPDQGAFNRMGHLFPNIPAIICNKQRDQESGNIIHHEVPALAKDVEYLIVDDLCDGGRTFINIAQANPQSTFSLYVTHGVFSQGLDELKKHFKRIWASNSYPGNEEVKEWCKE